MRPGPEAFCAQTRAVPARALDRAPCQDRGAKRPGGAVRRSIGSYASRAALAALLLLSACSNAVQDPSPLYVFIDSTPPGLCRIGPDEGPPLADRGIGGTGLPVQVVDRGIGGTGAPTRTADRGIGGTGIIAVITGFASICLGGMEVALDDTVPVTLNGEPVGATALRAGQLAVVEAFGTDSGLSARSVALRQEVSGPVESVGTNGQLRVAGQAVQLSAHTFGARHPQVGDWIAVSGLRNTDGVVHATRIDPRGPGEVLVRGEAVSGRDGLRIGSLRLRPDQSGTAAEAGFVTATGRYRGGVLDGARLAPDRLATDPAAVFPASTRRILLESYTVSGPDGVRLGSGAVLPVAPGLATSAPGRAMVEMTRQPGGSLRATGLRLQGPGPARLGSASPGAEPAGGGRAAPGTRPLGGPGQRMGGPTHPGGAQPAPVPRRIRDSGASAALGGERTGQMGGAGPGAPGAGRLVPGGEGMPDLSRPNLPGGLTGGPSASGARALPNLPRPPR